jgi:signal transduction histidine kinase/DNA-binding response OmpR family regulator
MNDKSAPARDGPRGPTQAGFLSGGGELGELIRSFDWASTPLGPPEDWPQNLRMALRIMLTSRQPIWIGWGEQLTYFYNDPYKSIIGGKHPWALGRPTTEVWREIWNDIGPMLETAMTGDQGTYVEAQFLIMERNGYPEETYYTFSYSPIPGDDGVVGGIICANSDDTQRVIGERQLTLLRDLAADTTHARTWEEVCERSAGALRTDARDIPFALVYMAEPDGSAMRLAAVCGIERSHPAAPEAIPLDQSSFWPVGEVLRTQSLQVVANLKSEFGAGLPTGPWTEPASRAAVFPILPTGETGRAGVLVVGLNPFRLFDDNYRSFIGLVAGQISAAIANANAYEEERHRAEALAEIDRAKTTFFSNVSHEFRTPLTLMMTPIEDALNDQSEALLAPAQRSRLETAHRNSLRLLKLVNSLLDFSRIEAGRAEASFEPTDLARLTAELASSFESATDRAGLTLRIDCRDLGKPVYVDRDMWEKIVLNLVSNAFKFTLEGEIAVFVRVAAEGGAAELTVRDTGVGVPESELPRLFERFHRVEGQKSRSFEGSGIGLALVQELVKLHGGTIRAESQIERGSAFVVSLPFGTTHLSAERIGAGRSPPSTSLRAEAYVEEALRWLPRSEPVSADGPADRAVDAPDLPTSGKSDGARVLVADDNADMRNYIRRLLGTRWTVEAVSDGAAAIEAIRARKPDLVLTDVMMPGLSGFGLLRELRGDPDLRDLPVIVLSARAGEEARVEGLDAGADDYLTKPFSSRELVARVNANLEMARIRREAAEALRARTAELEAVLETAPAAVWFTSAAEATRIWGNRQAAELLRLPPDINPLLVAPIGEARRYEIFRDGTRVERSDLPLHRAARGHDVRDEELEIRFDDGASTTILIRAKPLRRPDGAIVGAVAAATDITTRKKAEQILQETNEVLEQRVVAAIAERREAEAQLLQSQKMEAVGRLTGGVAHDFNNVLQVIGGNLQLLARDVAGNLRGEQRLQTAIGAISRGSKLASQLLAFGRRQPLSPKVVNLGRLIRGIDDMLRRALGESIEVESVVAGGLWNTFADSVQVENALLNLAINARDAMEAHGKLTIEAGNAFLDDAYATRHAEVIPGQYVMVAVTDTGSGIPAELLDRVFEPFFTTKPEGQGTGLGLSMVYGFAKQSGGHVKIYSEPGLGTTVRMYLPRSRGQEDVETDVEAGPATGGTETVLIVEDDEDVRSTVIDMLSELGYRVLRAKDAQSALSIVESGMQIDLLFTDVVMPGPMRSPELARKARERIPNIAVLFTSGYSENAIVHGGRLDDGIDLLSKPYTREALARKIRHVLRNHPQRRPGTSEFRHASQKNVAEGRGVASAARALRALLVEDEPLIRLSTADILAGLGHSVDEAGNAAEALALLDKHDFDVLITDLRLPGIGGDELAVQAIARQPELRVVFASGYEVLPKREGREELAGAVLLQKPYNERGIVDALDAVMSAPAKSRAT